MRDTKYALSMATMDAGTLLTHKFGITPYGTNKVDMVYMNDTSSVESTLTQ
jgi:hypothetical protein